MPTRRGFLKIAGIGAITAAAGGITIYDLLTSTPQNGQTSTTTRTTRATTQETTQTTTQTLQNIPLVVHDLNKEIVYYQRDLQAFVSGQNSESILQNGLNLRDALRNYEPENTESEGQRRRLQQLTLAGQYLYSWNSRLQEDDINIPDNFGPPSPRAACGEVLRQLYMETYPSAKYYQNVGKAFTDVRTETIVVPDHRSDFSTLYKALDSSARGTLRQALEDYDPQPDLSLDYKGMHEGHMWLVSLNQLLSHISDGPMPDIKTVIATGVERNSDLGRITNRGNTIVSERSRALSDAYSQHIDSTYSELPSNHRELSDYDFAMAVMNTPTLLKIRKDDSFDFILRRIFFSVSSLADRDSYTIKMFPPNASEYSSNSCIEYNGKYYWTDFWGYHFESPRLFDISGRDMGYGMYRKDYFFVVIKPLFGNLNAIPVFEYNPKIGVLDLI